MKKRKKNNNRKYFNLLMLILIIGLLIYFRNDIKSYAFNYINQNQLENVNNLNDIPPYKNDIYITINNNIPNFKSTDYKTTSFEIYEDLDYLGRATGSFANVGKETMPTEKRENLSYKPTGWQTIKYEHISGKYLYNRCHLIGFQLTGENNNKNNLITCTRSMNTIGMLGFENQIADYITKTNNHVLYRVTPIYEDENLLASGVQMEAYSIEDDGRGIKFNVFVYNVEDGIIIDYKTGKSKKAS